MGYEGITPMNMKEIVDLLNMIPRTITDMGLFVIILTVIKISPLEIDPWEWLKSFAALPKRLENLEREFNDDRAFRWRQMIINRSERIQDGNLLRKEVWKDTIETIGNYEKYCQKHPEFRNELATVTIEYMREQYKYALDHNMFL